MMDLVTISSVESVNQAGNSTHDSEIYHRLTTSFNKESFLCKLLCWVIHDDLAFDTVDSIRFRDMMLETNNGLVVFGCLQMDETIKRLIMDNYKAYRGIVTEKLRAAVGKIHISFEFSNDSTKTSSTIERRITG
jgi:hypothetical protein